MPRAALLTAPINPTRAPGRVGFTFRCAQRAGYGVSQEMARRSFERLDAEGILGSFEVLRAVCDTDHVGKQGAVWYVGGRSGGARPYDHPDRLTHRRLVRVALDDECPLAQDNTPRFASRRTRHRSARVAVAPRTRALWIFDLVPHVEGVGTRPEPRHLAAGRAS